MKKPMGFWDWANEHPVALFLIIVVIVCGIHDTIMLFVK